ncbi:DUF21 domain-containing protein At2g14520 isoform X2 [Beta vulgaris subsp. vulgaris]|uniref:DUF21 domain-containing protein At2g14520 isoform X2 n=1 Tax=Beta vulgaris subsp. vulgaris TaxID=3555 RepID=UPI002036CED8|nr:DUF21 domain-containing protein At2g14520 isoform X2 [Beta vulgaris subsp. vulgaris]
MAVEYSCCGSQFFIRIVICIMLVLFAGLMSGLTLGLMSLSLVELEVLAKSGTPCDRKYAAKILPVVKNQHLLLCTLLICNAAAMEALPIFLDSLVVAWGAILLSVTLILLFGEIIPQAVCSRYGLAIGAAVTPLVRLLVWICFPVAYPISKVTNLSMCYLHFAILFRFSSQQISIFHYFINPFFGSLHQLLDLLLGKRHKALFRRAELKTLVDLHGNEAGKGGELTHDETTIIAGALELTEKTARDAMTPIAKTFAIEINSKLDRDTMKLILDNGHSRVPVYYENPTNIIGLVLVKNLLTVNPDDNVPVKDVTIRKIPRVSENMPLYDILNEFQKGRSHMAVVIRKSRSEQSTSDYPLEEVKVEIDGDMQSQERQLRSKRSLKKLKSLPNTTYELHRETSKGKKWSKNVDSEILDLNQKPLYELSEDGEAIGIITMEDVMEELLQEEIYDETDHRHESL